MTPGQHGLFYFSHPYTGDEEGNFKLCVERSQELFKLGYNLYAPIVHTHPIQGFSHEEWLALDEEFLERCDFDGIILAPGWRGSKGCWKEVEWFNAHSKLALQYADLAPPRTVEVTPTTEERISTTIARNWKAMCAAAALNDPVNHPKHYCTLGAQCSECGHPIECIDVSEKLSFNLGNVVKYCWREGFKGGVEDLQKAQWYLDREIERVKPTPTPPKTDV